VSAEREPSVDQTIADPGAMHAVTPEIERAAEGVFDYARERLHARPRNFAVARTPAEMQAAAGDTVTEDGIGADAALRLFAETLAPASVPVENTRFLAFIPTAPTPAAKLFDMALSATPMYAGSWRSSAGSVYAENQALRWLSDLAGLPETAGGCFVQGGTVGNLSALVSARHAYRAEHGRHGTPLRVAATGQAHSSVGQALDVMDAGLLEIEPDARGRMTGAALEAALAADGGEGVFAVAATGGTTNLGVIDDLAGIADVCARRGRAGPPRGRRPAPRGCRSSRPGRTRPPPRPAARRGRPASAAPGSRRRRRRSPRATSRSTPTWRRRACRTRPRPWSARWG